MSVETLTRPNEETEDRMVAELSVVVGKTAFELLAIEAGEAADEPESDEDLRFVGSVTRLGDGQTVPDER